MEGERGSGREEGMGEYDYFLLLQYMLVNKFAFLVKITRWRMKRIPKLDRLAMLLWEGVWS